MKAAEENARIGAFIANAGTVGEIEAANAAKKVAAEAGAKSGAELGQKNAQRTRDADQTLALLDEAEKILPSATGSGLGALRDAAAGQVGLSTAGAQATAKLNIISSQLVQKVPRFEGPQSNIDVQSYREAAGDLANPRKTVAERLAAAQTMRQLQLKYASPQAQEPAKVDQVKFQQAGDLLKEARNAIMRGAPKEAVRQRLIEQGFSNIAGRL